MCQSPNAEKHETSLTLPHLSATREANAFCLRFNARFVGYNTIKVHFVCTNKRRDEMRRREERLNICVMNLPPRRLWMIYSLFCFRLNIHSTWANLLGYGHGQTPSGWLMRCHLHLFFLSTAFDLVIKATKCRESTMKSSLLRALYRSIKKEKFHDTSLNFIFMSIFAPLLLSSSINSKARKRKNPFERTRAARASARAKKLGWRASRQL